MFIGGTLEYFRSKFFQELNLEYCVVMVIATSGHGEMPMDFRNNWKLMCRKALPDDWLSNVCIFISKIV